MPYRSQAEPLTNEQPSYPDRSPTSRRHFADQMAPSEGVCPPFLSSGDAAPAGTARTVLAVGEAIIDRVSATSITAADCASAIMDSAANSARSVAQDLENFAR